MLTRLTQAHKTKMHLRLIKYAANLICDSNETNFTRNDLHRHNVASTNLVTSPTPSHNLATQNNQVRITSSTKATDTKPAKKGSLDDKITQAVRESTGLGEQMRQVRVSCGVATKNDLQPLPKSTETPWEAAARVGYEYFGIKKEDQEKITPKDLAKTIGAALESNPQDKAEIEKAMGYISASKLATKDNRWFMEFSDAYQKEIKRIETANKPANEAAVSEENTANTTAPNMMS